MIKKLQMCSDDRSMRESLYLLLKFFNASSSECKSNWRMRSSPLDYYSEVYCHEKGLDRKQLVADLLFKILHEISGQCEALPDLDASCACSAFECVVKFVEKCQDTQHFSQYEELVSILCI